MTIYPLLKAVTKLFPCIDREFSYGIRYKNNPCCSFLFPQHTFPNQLVRPEQHTFPNLVVHLLFLLTNMRTSTQFFAMLPLSLTLLLVLSSSGNIRTLLQIFISKSKKINIYLYLYTSIYLIHVCMHQLFMF